MDRKIGLGLELELELELELGLGKEGNGLFFFVSGHIPSASNFSLWGKVADAFLMLHYSFVFLYSSIIPFFVRWWMDLEWGLR